MTTPDVLDGAKIEKIVAGLSEAETKALLSDGNTPADDLARDKPGIARRLHDRGFTFIDWSPQGYAVRAHLARTRRVVDARSHGGEG